MDKSVSKLDKYLNTDFRIVIDWRNKFKQVERKKNRCLIGRSGLINLLGRELYTKVIIKAYKGNSSKITIKLRRGIDIILYTK